MIEERLINYQNRLDIRGFSKMMNNPSYSYKFFWLEALVEVLMQGQRKVRIEEVIDNMIIKAWYPVTQYHIHLSGLVMGEARDGLERAVYHLRDLSGLEANASKLDIEQALRNYSDQLKKEKIQLIQMVPYRALSGFFSGQEKPNWQSKKHIIAYIDALNTSKKLPYTFEGSGGLDSIINIDDEWASMIEDNVVSILGWIQFEKLKWLQNNNQEVPGLVYKLNSTDFNSRKLGSVHKLWDAILEEETVLDVFTGKPIDKAYDLDHFIPWSFVMCDEIWNLGPMDSSLNSKKSNKLPKWERYFKAFAENQLILYRNISKSDRMHELFKKCYKDNLHSIWAYKELYRPGNSDQIFVKILESNMQPIYKAAQRQMYDIWDF